MRLIDADKLRYSQRYARADPDSNKLVPVYAVDHKQIDETPTVDAVPVVRCKDCVSYGVDAFGNNCCNYPEGLAFPDDNSYCCFGLRRKEDIDNG